MDPVMFLWLIAIVLVAAGVAGLVLPVLPGAALLLAGLVMAAWIENFQYVGVGTLAALADLGCLIFEVDFSQALSGAPLGARRVRFGAARCLLGYSLGCRGCCSVRWPARCSADRRSAPGQQDARGVGATRAWCWAQRPS
jgi:hypothetical protein